MIMGPRPTLGWLGYLVIGGSFYRIAFMMVAFSLVSLLVLEQSQKVITLRHVSPAPFPPPVMFVHTPNNNYLTPLDACSVEAATTGLKPPKGKRRVYVYLWQSTVTTSDVWANWILQLPMVHVTHMDLRKLVTRTEIESLRRANEMETWKKWLAARLALLWTAGGIAMPFGTIMTKHLALETANADHLGLLLEGEYGLLDPIILATPSHHPITNNMIRSLTNDTWNMDPMWSTPEGLLTKSVKEGCGDVDDFSDLSESSCKSFSVLTADQVVPLIEQEEVSFLAEADDVLLLRYQEESYSYLEEGRFQHLFQINNLKRFCPDTARFLELRGQTTTL